jgi:hypothetical protein
MKLKGEEFSRWKTETFILQLINKHNDVITTIKGQLKKEKSLPDQEHKQRDLTHDLDVQAASKAHHRISHIYGNVAQNLYPDLCGSELVPKVVWIQSTIYNNS